MGYATRSKAAGGRAAAPAKALAKAPRASARAVAGAASKVRAHVARVAKAAAPSAKDDPSKAAARFPDVPVLNEAGDTISSADIVRDAGAVVFLYPRANTPGCTKQACGFRDEYDSIKKAGFNVYGLSYDSPKSQNSWAKKHNLPYGFLCDTLGGGLIKALGAGKPPKGIKRSHFVVQKGGAILDAHVQISPGDSVAVAAKFIEGLAADGEGDTMKDETAAEGKEEAPEPMEEDASHEKAEKAEEADKEEKAELPEKAENATEEKSGDETVSKPEEKDAEPENVRMEDAEEEPAATESRKDPNISAGETTEMLAKDEGADINGKLKEAKADKKPTASDESKDPNVDAEKSAEEPAKVEDADINGKLTETKADDKPVDQVVVDAEKKDVEEASKADDKPEQAATKPSDATEGPSEPAPSNGAEAAAPTT